MINKIIFLLFWLALSSPSWTQNSVQSKPVVTSGAEKPQRVWEAGIDANAVSKTDSSHSQALTDVLFATNEDCRLFINGESKGSVSKDKFLYLKLPPGIYYYIAKSVATGDEWRDGFSLAEGKSNEVFIDMLYTIDAGKEIGAAEKKTAQLVAAVKNGKPQASTKSGQKPDFQEETEQSALQAIVANMIPVKGGSFVMGNNKSPAADETEHPVLLNSFFMSQYEVTQQQWEKIMGYNPSVHKGCPDCPVENVSWEEVMLFVRKMNSISTKKFRLPTEAEWEYVARMGGKAEIDRAGGVEAYIRKAAWAFTNSENKTHPVGKKQPNVSGIYDLFGNVSEWCMDWYGAFFYKEDYTEKDPEGPPLGKEKIVRGGNYKDYAGDRFRPSFRNKMNPKTKGSEIGFRLVMEWED